MSINKWKKKMNILHLINILEITDDEPLRRGTHYREYVPEEPVSLFTDIFSIPEESRLGEVVERRSRFVNRRCRYYASELHDDGVTPPLAALNLPQEEGENTWCTTCNFRIWCKAKRRIGRAFRSIRQLDTVNKTIILILFI